MLTPTRAFGATSPFQGEERTERPAVSLRRPRTLHTLYISPLKALAVDVARNLETPVAEMGLDVKVETRTGDTPASRRQRQRYAPPDILLTTPEQLALLLSHRDARRMFENLRAVVLDELHAIHNSKRGDLLALGLARLSKLAPSHRRIGLSATVADPAPLQRYLVPQPLEGEAQSALVRGAPGAIPEISILASEEYVPWAGHLARHAMADVMTAIKQAKTTLVFVNTRRQAELTFQDLWRINTDNLPIALHHGSLAPEQRRKVEAAMSSGRLRAVVCTSTLDLGIDWGAVDNVVCVGAPKGAARLVQRIGRANHRLDDPSRALLVPANRFEVLECEAAREAVIAGELDGDRLRPGSLDVLAQHVLGMACSANFDEDALYREVVSASSYHALTRDDFARVVDFVATGGYALKRYDRYAKLRKTPEGPNSTSMWRLAHPNLAQQYRLNVGTIVEEPMIDVRLQSKGRPVGSGGRTLGQMEEYFIEQLVPGDTFVFGGEVLQFHGIHDDAAFVSRTNDPEAEVPSYTGGKFPLSTFLAQRVREMVSKPETWNLLPDPVHEWLRIQEWRSVLPQPGQLLVETFPRGNRFYLVCYPFEGRLAHQTLGMLVTRRLERLKLQPTGFSANEYALAVWGRRDMSGVALNALFDEDMLGDDLDAWLAESNLYKRTFRNCAIIAGLIERRTGPNREKTGRQVTFSTDLIYDVLREHEADHILLRATYQDAATGLLDVARLGDMLKRIKGRIISRKLDRVSPLAVPALLEISKEIVGGGDAGEEMLREAEEALIADAMRME